MVPLVGVNHLAYLPDSLYIQDKCHRERFCLLYAVLMAHGRTFLPDHLLGRGMTMMNFTFMTGAAVVQYVSGRVVDALKASGESSVDVFATLHLGFGIALLLATLVYLTAREAR